MGELNNRLWKIHFRERVGNPTNSNFAPLLTKKNVMMKNMMKPLVFGLFATAFVFSGCGNVDIVKRRHMPGYHIEVNKKVKHDKAAPEAAESAVVSKKIESIEVRDAHLNESILAEEALTASAAPVVGAAVETPAAAKASKESASPEKRNFISQFDFKHQLNQTKNALKAAAPAGNTHWMAWVAFGAGLGAAFFGLIGLIVAFFGIPLWWLAILLGITAIVFAIIHSKNNYSGERFRKLGLLFGIIGAGLGIIGMIIYIVWAVGGFGVGWLR